jgi:hypothetical protein
MSENNTTAPIAKVEKKVTKPAAKYVTEEKFNQLTDVLKTLVDTVTELKNKPVANSPEAKELAEVKKAKQDEAPINPSWEEDAREIIGEAVDHCEVFYPKGGGTIYTVVIKPEFSNAPKEYLERNKVDRRSREIGAEGFSGVQAWNKLVRQNLKRSLAK